MENNNKNTSIAPITSNQLSRVGYSIAITNKLLARNIERLKEIIFYHKDFFIDSISEFYPLSEEFIETYKEHINWYLISKNENLLWSKHLIEKFKDKWHWGNYLTSTLSSNKKLPWSEDLIDSFIDKWDWDAISRNQSIPWSTKLIEKYENKLFFGYNTDGGGLSSNTAIPWTKDLIIKYKDKWYWSYLTSNSSIIWDEKFKKDFTYELIGLDIEFFFKGSNIFFSVDNESISSLGETNPEKKREYWDILQENRSVIWSIELIDKCIEVWDWIQMSKDERLPWSTELISRYKDKWDWNLISRNENIPWSIELIQEHKENLNWHELSYNSKIPWTSELIEKFKDKWNWVAISNSYRSIPWSIEFIEKYQDKLDFYYLSSQEKIPWTIALIEKYEEKWSWARLFSNNAVSLTIELIKRNIEKSNNSTNFHRFNSIYNLLLKNLTEKEIEELLIYQLKYINE